MAGFTPYFLKIFFKISGDFDFDYNPSNSCFKSCKNWKHQSKKFKELLDMMENSKILMSEKDSKMMFFALKRLFYCCIRSSDEDTKLRKAKRAVVQQKTEFDFEDISTESEKKINDDALTMIHNQGDEDEFDSALKRKPMEKKFRYDQILVKQGKSEDLEEELVKVELFFLFFSVVDCYQYD